MTFEEILDAVIAMLQRRGRVTYSTLKRQFQLDEDALSDLKEELLFAHPQVRDEAGRGSSGSATRAGRLWLTGHQPVLNTLHLLPTRPPI